MDQNLPLTPVYVKTSKLPISPGRSLKKVALLNILTLGLYSLRWFYLNWKDFRGKAWPNDFSPLMRTVGVLIPILGLFLVFRQFKEIQNHASDYVDVELDVSPKLLTICWYLQFPMAEVADKYLIGLEPLPTIARILLSTFVLVTFQRLLNAYWQQTEPDLPLQKKFTTGEKIVVTLGSFWWFIFLFVSLYVNLLSE